jgi:O-antigen/teichoic acid export membrane protein
MIAVLGGIYCWGLWAQNRDGLVLRLTATTAIISLPLNFFLIPRLGLLGAAGVGVICEILMLLATAGASRMLFRQSIVIPAPSPKAAEPD